jgi:hypothetical protein
VTILVEGLGEAQSYIQFTLWYWKDEFYLVILTHKMYF